MAETNGRDESLTAALGRKHMIPSDEVVTTSEAQDKHLRAFEKGCNEWQAYQVEGVPEHQLALFEDFVITLLLEHKFHTTEQFEKALRVVRKSFHVQPSKPQIVRAYYSLLQSGRIEQHPAFERVATKKAVRSNSGVVVITVVTAPGRFSCPHDCFYCPDEPGQPRSYLSTEPAVARANQNEFDPVRQFYDRAGTLAKQGHTVDKVEIIVLGGTWSGYPRDYQEEFCRDLFYAANTFDEALSQVGERGENAANTRQRLSILEEQHLNEVAEVKIIGLTLETRPDFINKHEVRLLRRLGCTRVQLGVQHTDTEVLQRVNRGHERCHAASAIRLLKVCGFKVDIHIMPDLPGSDPEKDWIMFQDILHGDELQADHWKIYPCEITPFTKIEQWYKEGSYMPYAELEPQKLTDLLTRVKAEVHPWIRLNRVIRDIPEVSIIAGNSNTNLRQAVFAQLKKQGKSCRCIRCREVRDWPEGPENLRVRIREYRSSNGDEFFISVEGGQRGLGGGATQRALDGGKKLTKKEKANKKKHGKGKGKGKEGEGEVDAPPVPIAEPVPDENDELQKDNTTLYGLLRLRLNDNGAEPGECFPELSNCALIRELHVYGALVAARDGEAEKLAGQESSRPQHGGIGRTLMATAEHLAASRGWEHISVIAGVGVRNYYRKLGYELRGQGQYLVKEIQPCKWIDVKSLERPFLEASAGLRGNRRSGSIGSALAALRRWTGTGDERRLQVVLTAVLATAGLAVLTLSRRWRWAFRTE
eukprot:gnl/TRDRNA2_/TRDRNA2_83824_c0_seq2.p1 gnl/TRDRNA2_/TRDRNA2_83824_c0~~gnl/TRDRNA2_/TRDRNA2_83824_c0_seq2.p1  ORF type:complete len:778 (+),score=131.95 gnl/TRDRNA2_/TRDRNA2_83824_c0_seq2:60-2336(+)